MSAQGRFRVAVRKFAPFESAVRRQWQDFQRAGGGAELALEAVPLELHDLHGAVLGRSGDGAPPWDVAFVVTDWVAEAHASGCLRDLSPWLASRPPSDYPQGWSRSLLRHQEIGGQVLGLPYHDGPECLIYRRDLFDDAAERVEFRRQHGRALRVPATWDEFHEVARFFHRPADGLSGTAFAAFPDGHNTVYDLCLQAWSRGGALEDRAGRLRVDTPEVISGLEYYRALLADGAAVHPRCRLMDSVASGLAFSRGEIAMMVNWFGFAAMCETIGGSRVAGRVAIADVPSAPGCASASLNLYWLLSVCAASQHPETAYGFIRHCCSPPMDKLLTLEGGIGCRASTWSDPEVNRRIPFYHALGGLHANARELPRLANWSALATIIDGLVIKALASTLPVAALVGDAQRQLDEAAGRSGRTDGAIPAQRSATGSA